MTNKILAIFLIPILFSFHSSQSMKRGFFLGLPKSCVIIPRQNGGYFVLEKPQIKPKKKQTEAKKAMMMMTLMPPNPIETRKKPYCDYPPNSSPQKEKSRPRIFQNKNLKPMPFNMGYQKKDESDFDENGILNSFDENGILDWS